MMYAYQSNIYCDNCGDKITTELTEKGVENTNDTEDFPQWAPSSSEADSPQHCSDCNKFLGNDLTEDGRKYVADQIARHVETGEGDTDVLKEWAEYYEDGLQFCDIKLNTARLVSNFIGSDPEISNVRIRVRIRSLYEADTNDKYSELPFYDDYGLRDSKVGLIVNEFGVVKLIIAQDESGIWSVYIDECEPISDDEVSEAYDEDDDSEDRNLIEGYEYQSNATGTGIVNVGHHTMMAETDGYDIILNMKF